MRAAPIGVTLDRVSTPLEKHPRHAKSEKRLLLRDPRVLRDLVVKESPIGGVRTLLFLPMVKIGNLEIANALADFVADSLLPGTDVAPDRFWAQLEDIVTDLQPRNDENLARRDELQALIDQWHIDNRDSHDQASYTDFLREIGYLKYFTEDVEVVTTDVDREIASVAGRMEVVFEASWNRFPMRPNRTWDRFLSHSK